VENNIIPGVSIVICTHNGAQRLPRTLDHIANQKVQDSIAWEVILVDNASTDQTTQVTLANSSLDIQERLIVVHEPQLGLMFARTKGLSIAKYEYVSFVDDDNWIFPDWITSVYEIMQKHPEVGAIGGISFPVFEVDPPGWFEDVAGGYAVGPQATGEYHSPRIIEGTLWGAGLTIRRSAWMKLLANGFRPMLIGRQGHKLGSGDDDEICWALRLAGWTLLYDPRLKLCHYIPASRLTWSYVHNLYRGFGEASVIKDLYKFAMQCDINSSKPTGHKWLRQLIQAGRKLVQNRKVSYRVLVKQYQEGCIEELTIEQQIGRVLQLLRWRARYDQYIESLRRARWNRLSKKQI
jgi:glycosyltransferase involved in cell wall biosynthesis